MDGHRPLQIEVLINSPGPHDQVRVRDPFLALQRLGVDCRIHERPFRFNSCIRPHSLVIWQRPMPESRQRQWEHLQWLRERGCLLLTEWDDHPRLFPQKVQGELARLQLAPLELCHGIHTSSSQLAEALRQVNPVALVLDNNLAEIPALNLHKHSTGNKFRIFVGNQNRTQEHEELIDQLLEWLKEDQNLQLVIVGSNELIKKMPSERIETHTIQPYSSYRKLLQSCHISLLPLNKNLANRCKTPIKWLESIAESVAVVAGPELYNRLPPGSNLQLVANCKEIIPLAIKLRQNSEMIKNQVKAAHQQVWEWQDQFNLRIWLYEQIWKRRKALDNKMLNRLASCKGLPATYSNEFKI